MPLKRRPWYLYLVDQFLSHQPSVPSVGEPFPQERVKQYLEALSRRKEDWQVRQAEQALALYEYYKSTLEPEAAQEMAADSAARWAVGARVACGDSSARAPVHEH